MPGKLRIRASYQHDAAFLLKLAEAIERDDSISSTKKEEVIPLINDLSFKLLQLKTPTKKAANG